MFFGKGTHTVQDPGKSQKIYSIKMVYIFEIHYMVALKRRITVNHRGTRSEKVTVFPFQSYLR